MDLDIVIITSLDLSLINYTQRVANIPYNLLQHKLRTVERIKTEIRLKKKVRRCLGLIMSFNFKFVSDLFDRDRRVHSFFTTQIKTKMINRNPAENKRLK